MKVYLDCRSTGRGAYTAFHRSWEPEVFDCSKSGNHWQEVVDVEPGDMIAVHDISNSGKHNCYVLVVSADGEHRHVTPPGWRPEHCPVCADEVVRDGWSDGD